MSPEQLAALDAAIAALPIKYTADFVPQSRSRNAGSKDRSLNWRVTLIRTEGREMPSMTTDYMQGIAHLPEYQERVARWATKTAGDDYLRRVVESGRYVKGWQPGCLEITDRPIPPPRLRDVLASLVLDAAALDAGCFEDWAAEFGYEEDSRKAEHIYQQCVQIGRQLATIIGRHSIAQLRELFQDY